MPVLELLLVMTAAIVALGVLSARLSIPQPVMLVTGGAVLALLPGLPQVHIDPETTFQLFVPPLLYRAALDMSLHEFKNRLGGIGFLSFTMVLATMTVVAVVAHAIGLAWGPAFVLGAIVSPPDAVAAISLTRRVRLPPSVVTLLRGEGLVNDATALVAFRMAVAVVVSGSFSLKQAALDFVSAAAIGLAMGGALGWLIARVRGRLRDLPAVENTISLLTPFLAFLPAEHFGGSGVLAIVGVGLYLGRWSSRSLPPITRLQSNAMWEMIVFLLEGLIFLLVGFELPRAFSALGPHDAGQLALWCAAIVAAVVLSRIALVLPRPYFYYLLERWRGIETTLPPWTHVLLVGWSGVRGGESLVIALSLPYLTAAGAPLPSRDLIIFLTVVVIVGTLLLQGLTLGALVRLLGLRSEDDDEICERRARRRLRDAGLASIARQEQDATLTHDLAQRARTLLELDAPSATATGQPAVLSAALSAQRRELLEMYESGTVNNAVMRRLMRELDLRHALAT